jgi:PTH2 family peptidyl-tRNA hydrolase
MAAIALEDSALTDSPHVPAGVELKMVICVRTDIEMSKGKVAAQVGHAVLGAYRVAQRLALPREWSRAWLFRAQAKITLKADSEPTLDAIAAAATTAGIPWCIIEDAGRTEVEPGTRTVIGVGPAPKSLIDAITGPKGSIPLRLLN